MHLWPSMRLRDSFKEAYLKKLDWNIHRMNSQKQNHDRSSNQQKLLEGTNDSGKGCGGIALFCCEIFMVISCCYCCFCCGACIEDEESS